MDTRDNGRDEPPTGTVSSANGLSPKNLALAIIGVQILLALLTYPFMPEMVPSHWNAAGQVNGYMSKYWNALFGPGLSVLTFFILRALISNPRLGGIESQHMLSKYRDRFLIAILLFFLALQGTTTAFALGYRVDVIYVINIAVALLLIVLGNYMGKLRRNFWIGIRTPWTLASDVVWERTHRLGGWLFVLAGTAAIIMNFIAAVHRIALIVPVVLVVVITAAYSYVIYQRLDRNGGEPLSPPFHAE